MYAPFPSIDKRWATVTENDVKGKVYVTEFFFTTCPGICPKMNTNMRMVYDKFKNENNFLILSHTVDPDKDSIPRLKVYADSLGADVKELVVFNRIKRQTVQGSTGKLYPG